MQNKICVVTGANSGIGKVTALELAKQGVKLILTCRTIEKAEKARDEIALQSKNGNIDIFAGDFASITQTRKLGEEIKNKYPQIDILINNAGFIAKNTRELTEDGLESTFAVNHLGYFILSNLLRESLLASPEARIISVSSEAHRFAKLDLTNLQLVKGYNNIKAYAISKLLNILFTRELARRTQKTNITANCLHPGAVSTNFASNSSGFFKYLFKFGKPLLLSPEKGAETMLYLAISPKVERITGEYFDKKKIKPVSIEGKNDENAASLWELSSEIAQIQGQTF